MPTLRGFLRWPLLLAIAVLALAAFAAVGLRERPAKPASDAAPAAVAAAEFQAADLYTVVADRLEHRVPVTGTLAPFTEAMVKARVAGELLQVAVREGERVKRGQVLARIDLTEGRARVAAREADVEAAKAQLVWSGKNRAQQQALLDKRFISQNAFDNVQSSFDVAAAKLRATEAELELANKALGDAVLASPIDGVVAERLAQPGERVSVDARILRIVDLSRLQLEASVPASEIGRVRVGQSAVFRVDGLDTRAFEGRVERINPGTSAGSRSISVYAVIDNAALELRAGMFAQGAIVTGTVEDALLAPASALRTAAGRSFVYAIDKGHIAVREVKAGPVDAAGRVQILEGLAAGERIVRHNLGTLRAGQAARVLESAAAAAR